MKREIIFHLKDKNKVLTDTYKTNEELAEILEKYNYFINVNNEGELTCINLKQVIFVEIKK